MPQRRPRPSFFLNKKEDLANTSCLNFVKTKYSIPNFWDVECLRKCFPALAMRVQRTGTLNSAGIEPVVTPHKLRMLQMFSSSLKMPFAQAVTGLYASLLLMNISFIDLFFFCTSETADPVALELYLFFVLQLVVHP